MSTIINIIKPNKKILLEIALCKLAEVFFILSAAFLLTKFIISPSEVLLTYTFVLFAGRFFISSRSVILFAKLSAGIQLHFRKIIHNNIFINEITGGELLTVIFDSNRSVDDFFVKVAPNIVSAVIFLPIFLLCAAFTDFLTALILIFTFPIAPILLWLIGKATAEKNARAWQNLQKLNSDFRELLSAINTLKMFDRIPFGADKIRLTSQKSSESTLEVLKLAFVSSFALELITTLVIAIVAVTLGLRLISDNINFQSALFLLLITPEFFLPVRKFGVAFHVIISARSSFQRLSQFLPPKTPTPNLIDKILMPPNIYVKNLCFSYKNNKIFHDFNAHFKAGKITALIGDSGAGKSTLLKLLAGILIPTDGNIFFNDFPTSNIDKNWLLSKISYSPQSPHLFNSSLFNNLTLFGSLDTANLDSLLSDLHLNQDIHSQQKLSRGQLQRLGLIRALIKNSSVILLDEPTAGLDVATEEKVLALIKKIAPHRTIIIATHREAVIESADEVLSLKSFLS
ncbi:MAG: ATP-binding cassette domain-containing protein [Selenomonadaceae bacterium]|nr:ATP-binding cassette domain-containing protein [Selenomonadaceae bacterium]